jgi:hypothetical protein
MTAPATTPRSLTQMLRDSDDATIGELFLTRPDLAQPPPTSFSQVASRATTRESVRGALDQLNALDLWVAQQASQGLGPVSAADIHGVDPQGARVGLAHLRDLALLWGEPDALRPVRALAPELQRSPLAAPPDPEPPVFDHVHRENPDRVDEVAAGSAFELVRRIEVLVEHTDHTPLRLRQDGGLAQREARVVASLLDLPVAIAVVHAQIAQAAGLLGVVPHGRTETLLPTAEFDAWQELSLTEQWAWTARGWREAHLPSGSARLKALCFRAFGKPDEARVLGPEDIRRWLGWHVPRLLEDASRRATTMLSQASWIGVTGLGALSSFGRGDELSTLERLLPSRSDTVLVQNDLTAIAAGPLTAQAARELGALADVESRGGATVYRFTVESLRRAHGLGWSSAEMTAVLAARSSTPIPQPLGYLIADLDRADSTPSGGGSAATRALHPMHQRPTRAAVTPAVGAGAAPAIDVELITQIVGKLRHAARPEEPADPAAPADPHELTAAEGMSDSPLETLREAVETGELVWVGYVDTRGATGERLVYATAVEEGRLVARDSRTAERLGIPVHRITVAHIIRGGSV